MANRSELRKAARRVIEGREWKPHYWENRLLMMIFDQELLREFAAIGWTEEKVVGYFRRDWEDTISNGQYPENDPGQCSLQHPSWPGEVFLAVVDGRTYVSLVSVVPVDMHAVI